MSIEKPQLDALIEEQERDDDKKTVTPEFISLTSFWDDLPGENNTQRAIFLFSKHFKLKEKVIADILSRPVCSKTIRRMIAKGFSCSKVEQCPP